MELLHEVRPILAPQAPLGLPSATWWSEGRVLALGPLIGGSTVQCIASSPPHVHASAPEPAVCCEDDTRLECVPLQ